MSLHEYLTSRALERLDPPWYAMLMTLMRRADSTNLDKLRAAWPDVWRELLARHNAPGGLIEGDTEDPEAVARATVDASGRVTVAK